MLTFGRDGSHDHDIDAWSVTNRGITCRGSPLMRLTGSMPGEAPGSA